MPKCDADDIVDLMRAVTQSCNAVNGLESLIVAATMMARYLSSPAQRRIAIVMLEEMVSLSGGVEAVVNARRSVNELVRN